jgi:Holin of 3TMs, for gene-transfer release
MALIDDPISAALNLGGKLIDRFLPDPATANAAKLELFKMQQSGELTQLTGQMDINKEEAKSSSLFVAGWRPYIGWICGTGLGYQFLVYPILVAFIPKIQQLDIGTLLTLLGGILGLSTLRTQEKLAGKAG